MIISNVRKSPLPNAILMKVDGMGCSVNINSLPYYIYNSSEFSSELELQYLLNKSGKMYIMLNENYDPTFLTDNLKITLGVENLTLDNKSKLRNDLIINLITLKFSSSEIVYNISVKVLNKIVMGNELILLEVMSMPKLESNSDSVFDYNRIVCNNMGIVQSISSNIKDILPKGLNIEGSPLTDYAYIDIGSKGERLMFIGSGTFKVDEIKISQGNRDMVVYLLEEYVTGSLVDKNLWMQYNAWLYSSVPISIAILNITSLKIINNTKGFSYGNDCIKELQNLLNYDFPESIINFHSPTGNIMLISTLSSIVLQSKLEELKKKTRLAYSFMYSIAHSKELSINSNGLINNYEEFLEIVNICNTRLTWEKSTNKFISLDILKAVMYVSTPETELHCTRIQNVAITIAEELSDKYNITPNIKSAISMGGLLHDIGKIFIPPSILNKPSKLTDEEFNIIKGHTKLGGDIFKEINTLKEVHYIIRHHHERYDGKGYPDGISLEKLPISVSIISLTDSVDAMLSARCYKEPMTVSYCVNELERCKGKQFHPDVVDAFLKLLKEGKLDGLLNISKEDSKDVNSVEKTAM